MESEATELIDVPGEELPSVLPPAKKKRGRPPKLRGPAAEAKEAKEAKEKPQKKPEKPKMPIPKAFTDALGDAPLMALGMVYGRRTGRVLEVPGVDMTPIKLGPDQIREFHQSAKDAWEEMVKGAGVQLPPWIIWFMATAMTFGSAVLMDKIKEQEEMIRKLMAAQNNQGASPIPVIPTPVQNHAQTNGVIPEDANEPGAYQPPPITVS